ncbi:MAG: leucine-rich repeat domain-containing protein [Lachnospiraceae bacterium]|nr:leucine-rich repeat domain-containing protein [Lachnospiraceae bacterium]
MTVPASNGFTMGGTSRIANIILLEGTLAGEYVADTCEYTYFYMLSGGEISNAGFNEMAVKYYPVTLDYNADEITITQSNLGSMALRPELVFAESNEVASISCVPKAGFNLGEGTYQQEGDATASQMKKEENGQTATYTFDMKEKPVTVTIACAGNKISVGKSVADPVAILSHTYTSEEPLYDFATLMIYNDGTEGELGYALADGQVLPAGLSLTDDGKLIGTPTTVNEAGTQVTFVVTGRNGTTAELILNIIVSADGNASQTNQDGRILVDDEAKTINCLGSSVLIEACDAGTAIYIDEDRDGVADYAEPAAKGDFSTYTLYGLKDYDSQRPLQIIMKGGALDYLYGAYNGDVTAEQETDNIYISVQGGSVKILNGAYTAEIAGGIRIERTAAGTVNSLNTCDSRTTYQYIWLDQAGTVTVTGDYTLTKDVTVTNFTIAAGTYQKNHSVTVNPDVTLNVTGNIYQYAYTNLYNKGTVSTKTYTNNSSTSAHFVTEGAKLLPEDNTFNYIYYPMTISCEDLPKNAKAPWFDNSVKTYEDVVYGSPSASTYFNYALVAGYTAYYRLNDGQETVLGTISVGAGTNNKYVYSERKPTNIHVFYVPNEIAAKVKFSVPTAEVNMKYDAENPLYDCAASIEISNDTDSEHGGKMLYQVKKGSSLPAGLRLEDGKIVGTPSAATNGAVPVTLLITGRNGMVTEASLEVSVVEEAEPVRDINEMISLSGSMLDLKGTSVVIYADASSSSYCNIYLDENHDGIADNDLPFKVNGSAKLSLSNVTIYGWQNTSAAYDGDITIYAYGGTIGSVYGVYSSSSSQIAEVNGKVSLYMQGTRVNTCTAAGYRASAKELNLYCTAGTLYYNVYGAYEPASVETVHFAFTKDALFYGGSNSRYYMAVTQGGTVTGNVYAQVGGAGTSYGFGNSYGRFYGVYNTEVSGSVDYSIQGNWRPQYENHFARFATITGDMDIDWQNGYVTTGNSTTTYREFAYDSVIRNLTVNVAADAVMSSSSAMYPYYSGRIQNVYMYVPDALSSVVSTALLTPNTSEFPVKCGYLYNKGAVWVSGEYTLTEDLNTTTLMIHSNGKLIIPENVALTTSSNVNCYGIIENEGTLTTNTTNVYPPNVTVYAGALVANEGTWTSECPVNCYEAIENEGIWNAKNTVQLNANATISNSGQWNAEKQVTLYQGAAISNKNLWNVKTGSIVYLNAAAAKVTNEGEWNTDGRVILNYADDVVENSGTWNMNHGVYINKGKVENSGTFNGKYYSASFDGCVYVCNGGTAVNTGNWMGNAYIDLTSGTMDNAGSLEINLRSTTDTTNYNLHLNNATCMLINREDAVLKLMARVYNYSGKIVNYGTVKQTYQSTNTSYMNLGNVYAAKPVTLSGDIANYTGTNFYYPAVVDYPETAVSGATLATTYSSGVEGDENQYLKAREKFTVTLAGYVGDYTKADVQSVVYGSAEAEATGTNTENQWQGTMPQESIAVKVNIVKNDASQIEITPGEVTIEKLTVNQRNNSIYDLKNLVVTNDDGTEGQVSYAVSSTKPLPEGLTLSNGVISGTPKYASSEPYTAEIIVTGKNLTTAVLKLTFTQIEKAVPSLTVPTGLWGYTNYKLSQVYGMPKPSTGTYSWPDATLDITEKCIAGEKFDLYFTPVDTDNYDWSKVNISAGTWNEEEKRVECKVAITMYTIAPSYTTPTDITAVYGQTLEDVKLPSDENGAFVWRTPSTSVGNVGNKSFYASYVPTDTKRYSTVNLYITVTVQPKEVTAKIPEGLKTYKDNTIGQVELPKAEGGTYKWLTAASTVVKENTKYKAVFIPDENTNYKWIVSDGLTYSEAYKGYVFEVEITVVYHEEGKHTYETKYDGTYHWKECICGDITDKAKHTLGDLKINGDTHIATCTFDGCEYQEENSHSYEKKVGTTEHWYECACHDVINRATHYYSRTVYNETEHWRECSCGAQTDKTAHAYNTNKSDSSSHWKQCSCGAKTDVETHKFETLKYDGQNHWYECACGVKNNVAAHTYGKWLCDEEEDNHYALCDCGAKITAEHKYSDCVSTGKSQHKEVCEDCGREIITDHTWDAGVVTVSPTEVKTGLKIYTCIACGEKKEEVLPKNEPPHPNNEHIRAYDENEHWEVCDDGDGYEFVETRESHTFTDWQIDDKTGMHWKECTVCGYKKQLGTHTWKTVYNAENHWQECGVCGLKKSSGTHSYVKRTDEVNHWQECSCGRRIEIEQHSYRSYSFDANGHWDECSCGKRANEAAHSYGKWQPTEDGSKHYHEWVCEYKEEAEHSADYVWTSDGAENHIGKCEQCGGNSTTEKHVWDAGKVTVSPTVSADGVRTYTCTKCKATKTEKIDKLAASHTHSFTDWTSDASEHWKVCNCGDEADRAAHRWNAGTVTQEPTETETGIKTYRCTVCGREKTEELAKLPHTHKYSEEYTYNETYHWKACSCGAVTARAAHQWDKGTVLKPATIEETGVMQYQCTICGAVKQTVLPKLTEAHEHSFGDWIASDDINHTRTCSCGNQETRAHSFGYWTKDDAENHKKTCRVCGHAIYEAHAWDAGKVTKEADEDELGVITYTCRTCGETKEKTYTLGDHIHSYGDAQMRDEQKHMKICQDATCGHMLLENHIWDAGKVTAAATETKAGTITYTCEECGYKKTEAIEKHAHECDAWEAAEDGVHHIGTCIYGDQDMTEEHTWNDGVITVPATEAAVGAKLYTCTKCGAEKTEVIPKHEHAYGDWVADGEKNHKKLCECGETVTAPHDWDAGYITKPATTTEEGEITYTCEDCGGTKVSPLAKVPENHKHKNVWVKKNADIHVEMCNGCGLPTGQQAPHDWDAGEVTVEPTEATEGVRTYHCTVCDAKKKETIAKLGHSYGEWIKNDQDTHKKVCACGDVVTEAHSWNAGEVTTAATAQAEGVKTYTCTVCGETKTEAIAKLPPETPEEPEPKEVGAEFTDEQSKAKFTVVDPASIDSEDKDTSPAVIYTGSVDANAQEIIIPDTITVDGVEYRVVSIADGAFKNKKKLKKITIGNCTWTIGNSAFEGCTSLKTVTFKKTSRVKTIGKKAFYKCTALTKITIPKSVVTIKESAFDGCKKLATVTFQSGSKLKTLGKKVFNNCVALKKIAIPKNVTTIASSTFSGCKKLATVTFQSGSKLKKIDTKAFNGCVVLKKITIPKNVTTIGSSAFNKCKKLGTITIKSTKLKKVGKNAFKGIKSTATIKVPSKKLAAYKKLLKNKGQGKKVKIKKI